MARLNLHARWLNSVVASRTAVERPMPGNVAPVDVPQYAGAVARLSCDANGLPPLFARARAPRGGIVGDGAAATVEALEVEQVERRCSLAPLARLLCSCRETLDGCSGALPPVPGGCLADSLRTLEIEYVRLCDAQRFYFERRLRQLRTGEEDDDPEFTVVLERVVHATDEGDDFEASVAQAVQAIASALSVCGGVRKRGQVSCPSHFGARRRVPASIEDRKTPERG